MNFSTMFYFFLPFYLEHRNERTFQNNIADHIPVTTGHPQLPALTIKSGWCLHGLDVDPSVMVD